jgi:hypothetical protein
MRRSAPFSRRRRIEDGVANVLQYVYVWAAVLALLLAIVIVGVYISQHLF